MMPLFLRELSGAATGPFSRLLENTNYAPRIAWYPSAGDDFRDLLHLNQRFAPPVGGEPAPPDLFLHTDYWPWKRPAFPDSPYVFRDKRTEIFVLEREELSPLTLPVDPEIVDFPQDSTVAGKALFFLLEITSAMLGRFTAPVLYLFVENAAFCALKLLPSGATVSHIVHVRYGSGYGGGKSTGVWLLNVLQRLNCSCFITDPHPHRESGDERVYELYPALRGGECTNQLKPVRVIPGQRWSNYGDVTWYLTPQRGPGGQRHPRH